MTAPTSHGYPDWGRFLATSDKIYDNFDFPNQNAAVESAIYFVGDVPYVGLITIVPVVGCDVFVDWLPDNGISSPIWTDTFAITNSATLQINLPVRAPYVRITWNPATTPFGAFGSLTSSRYPNAAMGLFATRNVLISRVNIPIGAGATVTSIPSEIIPGPAIWNLFIPAATWTASVDAVKADGTLTRLDTADNTLGKFSRDLYLPGTVCRVSVTNTTGAASAFNIVLMAKPLYGGN